MLTGPETPSGCMRQRGTQHRRGHLVLMQTEPRRRRDRRPARWTPQRPASPSAAPRHRRSACHVPVRPSQRGAVRVGRRCQAWDGSGQCGPVRAKVLGLGQLPVAQRVHQGRSDGSVGPAALDRSPGEHPHAALLRALSHDGEQPGLPDAGLPSDDQHPTVPPGAGNRMRPARSNPAARRSSTS